MKYAPSYKQKTHPEVDELVVYKLNCRAPFVDKHP